MPARPPRRRGASQRWLIVPLVITVLVVLIDASMHARSPQLQRTLSREAWADAVIPQITSSTAQGLEIAYMTNQSSTGSADEVAHELSGVASAAASTFSAVRGDIPPPDLTAAAGLLDACLIARQKGAQDLADAVQRIAEGAAPLSVAGQMASAVSDFQLGDNTYQLFVDDLPKSGLKMPGSRWAGSPAQYSPLALSTFSAHLLATVNKAPARPVYIDAVSTLPRPLTTDNGVGVLSPTSSISVTVVVANTSQAGESVEVTAQLSWAGITQPEQVSRTVGLAASQASAVSLPGMKVQLSAISTLTISAGLAGEQPIDTRQLRVVAPGPNFAGVPTTSTTLGSPTSTKGSPPPSLSTTVTTAGVAAPTTTTGPSTSLVGTTVGSTTTT